MIEVIYPDRPSPNKLSTGNKSIMDNKKTVYYSFPVNRNYYTLHPNPPHEDSILFSEGVKVIILAKVSRVRG